MMCWPLEAWGLKFKAEERPGGYVGKVPMILLPCLRARTDSTSANGRTGWGLSTCVLLRCKVAQLERTRVPGRQCT